MYIAMMVLKNKFLQYKDTKERVPINLPKGCAGILTAFETEEDARNFWGEDVPLVECEPIKEPSDVSYKGELPETDEVIETP